jgi:two-component system, OmpR family, alkaline phosphatase synthesis response regulator PhoP
MIRRMNASGGVAAVEPIHRTRVLVVEDTESVRALISYMLRRRGYEVVAVDNGPDALSRAMDDIDVVVMDVGLPGLNGLEVCRRLRAEPATALLPVILLTGRGHQEDVRDGLRAGANDFLTKPFQEADLLSALKRLS